MRARHIANDFRILMLNPDNRWEYMGVMGKWAAPGQIVTNYAAGGRPISLRDALKRSKGLSDRQCRNIEKKMIRIGYQAARAFSRRYKDVRKLGIDVAIDQNLRIWILEPNTSPWHNLFKSHRNYKTILKYFERIEKK